MALVLDFRVGQRVFRVTRTRRRKGAGQAELEELVDGNECPLADGVREIDRQIQVLLGLPYEAFTQAVVLPQGEFMKFLRSEPRKRREILRELLRLQIYERMRQFASERATGFGQAVAELERRLTEEYAGVTPEALADLRDRTGRVAEDALALESKIGRQRRALEELRVRQGKTRELRLKRVEFRTLEARRSAVDAQERRLDAARRAASLVAAIRAAEDAERSAAERSRHLVDLERALDRSRAAHDNARRVLAEAERAAEDLPALRDRIRQLDEIRGVVQARDAARSRLAEAEKGHQRMGTEFDEATRREAEARRLVQKLERTAEDASRSVTAVGYDADFEIRLEAVRDVATQLRALRDRAAQANTERQRAAERATSEETSVAKRQREAETAKQCWEEARHEREQADNALRDAQQKSAAALLRHALRKGEPCPVCEQRVATLPPRVRLLHIEALEEKCATATETEEAARHAAEQATAAATRTKAAAHELRAAAERAAKDATTLQTQLTSAERALDAKIGSAISNEPGDTIDARVLSAAQRMVELRRRHHQAMGVQQQAEKKLSDARLQATDLAQRVQLIHSKLESLADQISGAATEIAELDAAIVKVTVASNPLTERDELSERQTELIQGVEEARRVVQEADTEVARAIERVQAGRQATEDASRTAMAGRQRVEKATCAAGLADEKAVIAATLTPAEIDELAAAVDRYRLDLHALQHRIAELTEELANQEVSDEEVDAAEAAADEQQRLLDQMRREEAQLDRQIQTMAERLARAAALAEDLADRKREHRIYRRLGEDLRTDRFQAFVLDETFRELANGASIRLMALSGRYTLEYREDTFYVVDHDNAREQRSTDTLSGGETFLASLALALELSEQVQRASSAVPLDSLFIDEGFGTLDPATLDTAAGAIESLQVGGRMVGIITHVQDLADRLPARVVVEKRSDGSRIRVDVA